MHRVQLQSGNSDRLQVDVKEVAEGPIFSKKRKPWFSEGIRRVHAQFRYMLITWKWYRLATGQWYMLVQVYNGISHSDNVFVISTFGTYISRQLDGERIGGCSHLSFVAREHRGL
jgi:hypothetical protein